jgi:UDP-glucuronate 4-epimerase
MTRKILITGAAGFIGFYLTKALLERGDEVVGIDNINDYYDVNLKYARLNEIGISEDRIRWNTLTTSTKYSLFRFYRMSIEDKANLMVLAKDERFDIIIHLAGQAGVRYSIENPDAYGQSNLIGFLNILEIARYYPVKHLVYASSSSIYGMNKKIPFSTEDNVDHPISLYAATKKANELMAHSYSHLYKIPLTGLRFFTVYGPWGRPDMAYFLFADAISKGQAIKVFNHGKMKRDFTYIDDIVEGVIKVANYPPLSTPPYKVYNIGNNQPVELMDFIKIIGDIMGKSPKMEMLEMQAGDVAITWANIDESIKDFNYKPNTSIELGLSEFVQWYKQFYNVL